MDRDGEIGSLQGLKLGLIPVVAGRHGWDTGP
jgi:hypothetical protein